MTKELLITKTITLNAAAEKVWDALTNPAKTKEYMYNCEALSDWKVGSPLIWKGAKDGVVYVKGTIVAIEKGKRLQFTTFDPNSTMEDVPSNYITVTYGLSPEGNKTTLSIIQSTPVNATDAEKRHNESAAGWEMVLKGVKEVAEK